MAYRFPEPSMPRYRSGVLLGAALLLVVVAVNSVVSLRATSKLLARNRSVEHTRMVADELDATLTAALNMETGERGYLYTGQRQYLEPYELGASEAELHLNRLARLVADNPIQQHNLSRLRASVEDASRFFQQAVASQDAGKQDAAKQLVLGGGGKDKMGTLRAVLGEMKSQELALLASRSAEAQQSERYLLLTIPLSHALTAVLLVIAGVFVSRVLRKRVETARKFRQLAEREQTSRQQAEAAHHRAQSVLTELKRAQDALVRSEKLAAVGRMASTVAHEINNPLEAVTNLVWIARNDPSASDSVRKSLAVADEELRRVAHVTKQTLGFYRDSSAPVMVKMREVVDGVLGLYASRILSKQISVSKKYQDCSLYGYAGELRQLFSNLIANSVDAVQNRGTLTVKVSRSHAWRNSHQPGIRVTIADNGCGIAAGHVGRVFEPFFTTKDSTGTGLGLWVAKQIADKHSGWISVRSNAKPDQHYTVISVFLPLNIQGQFHEVAAAG
jgi:signal transduction histidine kinase